MKKKAIEKIPYLGLRKISSKEEVKYIGVTAVKIVGHEKHPGNDRHRLSFCGRLCAHRRRAAGHDDDRLYFQAGARRFK